jgi:hypothetical protein
MELPGSGRRTINLTAGYRNGEQLRRMLGLVRDLLAAYAKNSGAQDK